MPSTEGGPSRRVIAVAAVAALGGFLFGFDSSVINAAVPGIVAQYGTSPAQTGFVVSIALIGCAVGAWYAGRVADRLGRSAHDAGRGGRVHRVGHRVGVPGRRDGLMLWRFVGGLAIGAASVIAPAYIAEIAPAHLRGRLGSLQQLAIVTGIFLALLSGYAIATAAGGASQRLAARHRGVALDVPRRGHPGDRVPPRGAARSPRARATWSAKGRVDEARAVMASVGQDDLRRRPRDDARLARGRARAEGARPEGPAVRPAAGRVGRRSSCRCCSSSSAST